MGAKHRSLQLAIVLSLASGSVASTLHTPIAKLIPTNPPRPSEFPAINAQWSLHTSNPNVLTPVSWNPNSGPFGHLRARSAVDEKCPPCFNCQLEQYPCLNFGSCTNSTGKCHCGDGFGGDDCGTPLCDSPADESRRPRNPEERQCHCKDGWTGINCNICTQDDACAPLIPQVDPLNPPKCYSAIAPVKQNFIQCDVTNKKIIDVLEGKKPEITFSCDARSKECNFQFWSDQRENFFCDLQECTAIEGHTYDKNTTDIECGKMQCQCYPNRLLCGEGGPDLSDWFKYNDQPDGGPRGPAKLKCTESLENGQRTRICTFEEQYMNVLISQFFGDPYIQLSCPYAGECLHFSQVPGYSRPDLPTPFTPLELSLIILGAITLLLIVFGFIRWAAKKSDADRLQLGYLSISDVDDEQDEAERRRLMMTHHTPSSLMFRDVSYVIAQGKQEAGGTWLRRGRASGNQLADEAGGSPDGVDDGEKLVILEGVHGMVKSGQVMAIMGGSGAGKTTFLDILARRAKSGIVAGEILVNGSFMSDSEYRSIVGFVDQEDTLMDTLTVYETILYSALLRLPRSMTFEEKKARVMETMVELGIEGIANRRVGKAGARGISGGEKRRVSIACELVTSPSILFLDEPTSGLDSYNAYNVIECLVSLARTYNRTVICTIHQPRSNIYALFDHLVLLAKGRMVYSGPAQAPVIDHFKSMGFECPVGFNIADYLVDLTMHVIQEDEDATTPANGGGSQSSTESAANGEGASESSSTIINVPAKRPKMRRTASIREQQEDALFKPKPHRSAASQNADPSDSTPRKGKRRLTIQQYNQMANHLRGLVDGYSMSSIADDIATEINTAVEAANAIAPVGEGRPIIPGDSSAPLLNPTNHYPLTTQRSLIRQQRATWWTQFKILSGRTFKNLYRNPDLLRTHYIIAVIVALGLGVLFWRLDNTLAGFQNRMGVLFFVCAVFGFGCLSSMQVFASERLIFMRERANGYYSPITYFWSKVLFDLLPLRVIPPLLLAIISYPMMGLRSDSYYFPLHHILVLVLFNLTASACCLAISILFKDASMASLVAILVMLYEMLFGGLLLNKATMGTWVRWASEASFWNYAWEGLLVNEVNGLTLYDERMGLPFKIPGAIILQTFGLDALGFWKDVERLVLLFLFFLTVAFLWLQFMVKERR